jgi:hypothetical protein
MKHAIVGAIMLVGCGALVAPTATSTATPTTTTTGATTTQGLPADLATIVPKATVEAGPFAWPESFAPDDGEMGLQVPMCEADAKDPTHVRCGSSAGGPMGAEWMFEKTATGLRLAEVVLGRGQLITTRR